MSLETTGAYGICHDPHSHLLETDMCDNAIDEYNILMNQIRDLVNKQTPVLAKDIGSDGHDRYACPICDAWWYGKNNYCHNCGQKLRYD